MAQATPPAGDPFPVVWQGWQVWPVPGGHNNRLFRVTGPEGDLAVKFTRRDGRDRAGREFASLALLNELGLEIAPHPVLLECERYAYPVVVQTWLEGDTGGSPPSCEGDWQRLFDHYAVVHSITLQSTSRPVLPAVLSFRSPQEGARKILQEIVGLLELRGSAERPWFAGLSGLSKQLAGASFTAAGPTSLALARCDPNISNFIRRPGKWASVDWENSGWNDPACEIGDLLAHPSYQLCVLDMVEEKLHEAARRYAHDMWFFTRARQYYAVLLARWAATYARYWGERDAGVQAGPARLVAWPEEWWNQLPASYEQYLSLAVAVIS